MPSQVLLRPRSKGGAPFSMIFSGEFCPIDPAFYSKPWSHYHQVPFLYAKLCGVEERSSSSCSSVSLLLDRLGAWLRDSSDFTCPLLDAGDETHQACSICQSGPHPASSDQSSFSWTPLRGRLPFALAPEAVADSLIVLSDALVPPSRPRRPRAVGARAQAFPLHLRRSG
jgi:hypothetical protein